MAENQTALPGLNCIDLHQLSPVGSIRSIAGILCEQFNIDRSWFCILLVRQDTGGEMALQHPNMTVAHRQLTAKERQILEKQVLVHIGIVLPDGTPHVSAMWVDLDGEDIILNKRRDGPRPTSCASGAPSRSVSLILKTP